MHSSEPLYELFTFIFKHLNETFNKIKLAKVKWMNHLENNKLKLIGFWSQFTDSNLKSFFFETIESRLYIERNYIMHKYWLTIGKNSITEKSFNETKKHFINFQFQRQSPCQQKKLFKKHFIVWEFPKML